MYVSPSTGIELNSKHNGAGTEIIGNRRLFRIWKLPFISNFHFFYLFRTCRHLLKIWASMSPFIHLATHKPVHINFSYYWENRGGTRTLSSHITIIFPRAPIHTCTSITVQHRAPKLSLLCFILHVSWRKSEEKCSKSDRKGVRVLSMIWYSFIQWNSFPDDALSIKYEVYFFLFVLSCGEYAIWIIIYIFVTVE